MQALELEVGNKDFHHAVHTAGKRGFSLRAAAPPTIHTACAHRMFEWPVPVQAARRPPGRPTCQLLLTLAHWQRMAHHMF